MIVESSWVFLFEKLGYFSEYNEPGYWTDCWEIWVWLQLCTWNFIFFKMSRVPNEASQFSTECILEVRLLGDRLAEARIRQITST